MKFSFRRAWQRRDRIQVKMGAGRGKPRTKHRTQIGKE
jgi:hypothetical protein